MSGNPADRRDGRLAVEWGAASRPLPGEEAIGDRQVVRHHPDGVLVAVVDGLGHGADAASAAEIATSILEGSAEEAVDQLVRRCHERLRGTRGVVMSVGSLRLDDGRMSWLGVGNVEGVILRPPSEGGGPASSGGSMIATPGIVGYSLPRTPPQTVTLRAGDAVVLATDGVDPAFREEVHLVGSAQRIADRLLERHATGSDDALVLVLRLREEPA